MGDSHGENCAGGFGTEHQPVSRLNLLQMLFSTHHAGSKLETNSSAQTYYKTGAFRILAVTLLKYLCFSLHPAPFLWFYSSLEFSALLSFLCGGGIVALQMLRLQRSTAPQQLRRTQRWASSGDLPDSRGAAEVWVSIAGGRVEYSIEQKASEKTLACWVRTLTECMC